MNSHVSEAGKAINIYKMKKKILFILHVPPPVHGAAIIGKYIMESEAVRKNFDCDFINLSTTGNINDIEKFTLKKGFTIARLYLNIISALIRKQYDYFYLTINSRGPGWVKEMVIVMILKMSGKKIIYHYHNKGIADNHHNSLKDIMYRFQFRNSRAILVSPLVYNDISMYLPRDRVYFCTNGIPFNEHIDIELLNSLRVKKSAPEILFLSNIMHEKGVFTLLDACRILKNKKIQFRSTFIGPWADISEDDFNNYVKSNDLQGLVFYEGKKINDEKRPYFERADIFIFPTLNDIFGLVNLEAMQYGLPVISTNEGAISEIVDDNISGFLVPKKDSEALAERILFLMNNPELRFEMGKKGYRKFRENFSLEHFQQNFVHSLKQIIADFERDIIAS